VVLLSANVDSCLVDYFPGMELHRHVGTNGFHVDVEFANEDVPKKRLARACADAVLKEAAGVLVFLAGAGEIRDVFDLLEDNPGLDVTRLHSALSEEEASLAFKAPEPGKRKVVLATNIAETSLTLKHIEVVIDSGYRKRRSVHNGVPFMETGRISGKSWVQRKSRAGRLRDGRLGAL
jgi:ATP-dependent helicase HrpB